MTEHATDLAVRKTMTVHAARERAFEVFTEQMGSWWPLEDKTIGEGDAKTVILEPRAGGRWYERAGDGSECEWGRVIAFEAPDRLVLSWQIGADWNYDEWLETEVEVRFVAEDESRTRIELEHRGLRAYGAEAEQMYAIFDSPNGWTDILERFAAAA